MAATESMYGSDKAGMVWAYEFTPGECGRPIDSETAAERLAGQAAGRAPFWWLHFSLANAATQRWLHAHTHAPDAFYEALCETPSTRVEVVDEALLAIVNDVLFFALEASAASTVTMFIDRRVMVSARTTALRAIDRLRESVKAGETFRSPAELLAHLLRDQADVLVDIVRETTRQVDAIEDRIIASQSANRRTLGTVRRTLVRLQRLLAPEPAALFRLLNRPPAWLSESDVTDLRQSAEELSAAVVDSAALVERVRLLQEEITALVNEQTNQTLFILTVVTVLTLPMTIIPGLLGMNVGGLPLRENMAGFWLVVVALFFVVGLGGMLAWTRLRR